MSGLPEIRMAEAEDIFDNKVTSSVCVEAQTPSPKEESYKEIKL